MASVQLIVKVRKKIPFDDVEKKMRIELESRIEDIQNVISATFEDKVMKVYVQYTVKDEDEEPDINKSEFRNAVNYTKYFTYVGVSG